jgi:hypothetical protein
MAFHRDLLVGTVRDLSKSPVKSIEKYISGFLRTLVKENQTKMSTKEPIEESLEEISKDALVSECPAMEVVQNVEA